MKNLESEVGKELTYSAFETEDFEYRLGIHDRLVRDILDAPHTTLIDQAWLRTSIIKPQSICCPQGPFGAFVWVL
jgi:hypothetical protein